MTPGSLAPCRPAPRHRVHRGREQEDDAGDDLLPLRAEAVAATPVVASELGHRASLIGSVLLAAESTELLSDSAPRR